MITNISVLEPEFDCGGFPPDTRDIILVDAAKAGDQWAFVELCRRWSPMVSRAIYRVVKNTADAEDALQDCFLKAYRGLNGFNQQAAFSTWITRIGINSALMILRKNRKYREEPMSVRDNQGIAWRELDVADTAIGPDELYNHAELVFKMRQAIEQLPDSLRSVIELQHSADASIQEISSMLNISIPAVKSRLLRGRAALRRLLELQNATSQAGLHDNNSIIQRTGRSILKRRVSRVRSRRLRDRVISRPALICSSDLLRPQSIQNGTAG